MFSTLLPGESPYASFLGANICGISSALCCGSVSSMGISLRWILVNVVPEFTAVSVMVKYKSTAPSLQPRVSIQSLWQQLHTSTAFTLQCHYGICAVHCYYTHHSVTTTQYNVTKVHGTPEPSSSAQQTANLSPCLAAGAPRASHPFDASVTTAELCVDCSPRRVSPDRRL